LFVLVRGEFTKACASEVVVESCCLFGEFALRQHLTGNKDALSPELAKNASLSQAQSAGDIG
jgi:hypothetical protein